MTREEAIKYLINPVATSTAIGEEKLKEFEAYNMAIEALTNVQNIHKAEWIPVSERLPKEDAKYLVQMSYGIMRVLSWANILEKVDDYDFYNEKHGGWYELDSEWGYCEMNGVIAWMPLPKPYERKKL